jgi:hypothetical protein
MIGSVTYAEESEIAQRVLDQIAIGNTTPIPGWPKPHDVKIAPARLGDSDYTVHRHGNDLRFNEGARWGRHSEYLIVQILSHQGGWIVPVSIRPPGEYHDERAAEQARRLIERHLVGLGYPVGTPGRGGHRIDKATIEHEIASVITPQPLRHSPSPRRRQRQR